MPRFRSLAAPVALVAFSGAAPASAATSDRWTLIEHRSVPIEYYQGLTHAGSQLFFVGVFRGGYLTDARLRRLRANPNLIPPSVRSAAGFNHIGDPTYDSAGGGRLLAPLECYEPLRPQPNTCGFGGIGVVDPRTLAWRYWVRLDRAEVPKAMWAEVSPDGRLVWTSSGRDLVAYRSADISESHAATGPTSAPIRAVRRLRRAVPPSGAHGGAFWRGRLLLSGSRRGVPQVWAVNLRTGKRTLQLRLPGTRAEVEGLAVAAAGGGTLQLLLAPGTTRRPTYGAGHSELLSFVPRSYRVTASASLKGSTLLVRAALRAAAARSRPLEGATVRVRGRSGRTDSAGEVSFTLSRPPRQPLTVTVAKGGLREVKMLVRPRTARG